MFWHVIELEEGIVGTLVYGRLFRSSGDNLALAIDSQRDSLLGLNP